MLLLLLLSRPWAAELRQGELDVFADRVAQRLVQARETHPGNRVLLRVEDLGGLGAAEQLKRALEESLRRRDFQVLMEGESPYQVHAYLSLRRSQPLAAARITSTGDGQEIALLFTEFSSGGPPPAAAPESLAVAIRTRLLFIPDLPVLDIETDAAGNLFILYPDRLRVFAWNEARGRAELKAEIGLDTGAERLRDPLVRLLVRDNPRQLELHSAAAAVAPAPPLPIEGYRLRTFGASAPWRVPHPSRAVFAQLQPAAGKNYFRTARVPELYALAPVASPLRAHWVILDGAGRLLLADAELRPLGAAAGTFGGDVASVVLPCAGAVVLAAGADPNPARDRISVLRLENDRLLPYTHLELEGAVRRLQPWALPGRARVLALSETSQEARIEEIDLACSP